MRFAILGDGHLFQTFMKNYDPLNGLRRILQEIKEKNPGALLLAGDMFDYKKTTTAYLRHYEGEGLMIRVRNILEEFEIPIYAIRGNHEKEEVLQGLDQTVKNFHYVKNDWKNFKDASVYFMETHYEGEFYEPEVVSQIIKQITPKTRKVKGTRILLSHETFAPFENSLPKETIEKATENFRWIINGHMHFWNPAAYGLKRVVTLPAALPSRLRFGSYWMEQYVWKSTEDKFRVNKRESPFGYVLLDTEGDKLELHSFTPSKKILEISVDTTNLALKEVLNRFRRILKEIKEREDKDSLIILPEIHGYASFVTTFVAEVFKDYSELNIEELKNNTSPRIITASGKLLSPPLLTVEQLLEDIKKEIPAITEKLMENQIEINANTLGKILDNLYESGILESLPPRITTRLQILLSEILSQIEGLERPKTFEDDVKDIIKRVKER